MKSEQLYYFREAVRCRSISVAARKNYISQSSLSSSIARLEQELGGTLLRRSVTGVEPTALGKLALEKAEIILRAQQELLSAAKAEQLTGSVRLQCVPALQRLLLAKTAASLLEAHPQINLTVASAESTAAAAALSSGAADIGVVFKGDFLNGFREMTCLPLFRDSCVLWVGRKSPLWEHGEASLQDVLLQPLISLPDLLPDLPCYRTEDLQTMLQLIRCSGRAALLTRRTAKTLPIDEAVRALPVPDLTAEAGLLTSGRFSLSPSAEVVVQALRQAAETME